MGYTLFAREDYGCGETITCCIDGKHVHLTDDTWCETWVSECDGTCAPEHVTVDVREWIQGAVDSGATLDPRLLSLLSPDAITKGLRVHKWYIKRECAGAVARVGDLFVRYSYSLGYLYGRSDDPNEPSTVSLIEDPSEYESAPLWVTDYGKVTFETVLAAALALPIEE